MAIVTGPIKLEGRVGDLIFYRRGNTYCCRSKPVYKPERMTKASRQSSREFGEASRAGKILREAVTELWPVLGDSGMVNRINKAMYTALRKDTAHTRGKRVITPAGLQEALKGLHFNNKGLLRCQVTVTRQHDGSIGVSLREDWPTFLRAPRSASHIQVQVAAIAIDFATGRYEHQLSDDTGNIPLDALHNGRLPLLQPPALKNTTILILQMQFVSVDEKGKVYAVGGRSGIISRVIGVLPPEKRPKAAALLKKQSAVRPPKRPFAGLQRKKPRPIPLNPGKSGRSAPS